MSSTCLFYRNESRDVPAHCDDVKAPFVTRWCSMPSKSPVPENMAKGVIGAERILQCEGDTRVCSVPRRHFHQQVFEELAR